MGLYKLPINMRKELAKPIDLLFEGAPLESVPKAIEYIKKFEMANPELVNKRYIFCVGDVVSESFVKDDFLAKRVGLYIIDGKTLRTQVTGDISKEVETTIEINNPQGTISEEAIDLIKKIGSSELMQSKILFVTGEEDLLALPLVKYLPKNYLVFYGQPPITDFEPQVPAGLGMLVVSDKLKEKIDKLFAGFEYLP